MAFLRALTDSTSAPHPFDPLTSNEIKQVVSTVQKVYGHVQFKVITLHEPRKAEMVKWLENSLPSLLPARIADVTVIKSGGKVYDGLVDIKQGRVLQWNLVPGVQPIVCLLVPWVRLCCSCS